MFSTQAAYAAPLILLSQNRAAEHDRLRAEEDYRVNTEALEILKTSQAILAEVYALQQVLAKQASP